MVNTPELIKKAKDALAQARDDLANGKAEEVVREELRQIDNSLEGMQDQLGEQYDILKQESSEVRQTLEEQFTGLESKITDIDMPDLATVQQTVQDSLQQIRQAITDNISKEEIAKKIEETSVYINRAKVKFADFSGPNEEEIKKTFADVTRSFQEKFGIGYAAVAGMVTSAGEYIEDTYRSSATSPELRAMRKEVKDERADFYAVEQEFSEADMRNNVETTIADLDEEANIAQLDVEINAAHQTVAALLTVAESDTDMTLSELAKGTPEQQDAAELLYGLACHMVGGAVNEQRKEINKDWIDEGFKIKETKEAFRSDKTAFSGLFVENLDPHEQRLHALMSGDTFLGKGIQREYERIRKMEIKGNLSEMERWNTVAGLGEKEKSVIIEKGEEIVDKVKELMRDPFFDGKKDGKDVRAVLLLGVGFLLGRWAIRKARRLFTGEKKERTSLWKWILGGGLTLAGIYAFFKLKDERDHKENSDEEDTVDDASVYDSPEKVKEKFDMTPESLKPEFVSVASHTRDFAKKSGDVFQINKVDKYIVYGLNGSFETVKRILDKSSVLEQHYFGDVYGFFNRVSDWDQLSKLFGPTLMQMTGWLKFREKKGESPEITAENFQERLLDYLKEAAYGKNDFDNMLRQSMVVRMYLKNREQAVYREEATNELKMTGFDGESWPYDVKDQEALIDKALEDETFHARIKVEVQARFLDKQLISHDHPSAFVYLKDHSLLAVKEIEIPKEIRAIDKEKVADEKRMADILASMENGEVVPDDIAWMQEKAGDMHEALEEEISDSLLELMREPYSVLMNGKDFNHDEFVKIMETPIKELQGVIGGFSSKESFTAEDIKTFAKHINDFHNLRKRIEYGTVMYKELSYDSNLKKGAWTGGLMIKAFGKQYKIAATMAVEGIEEKDRKKITMGYALTLPTALPVHYGLKLLGGGGTVGKLTSIYTFPVRFLGNIAKWSTYKGAKFMFFPSRYYDTKLGDKILSLHAVWGGRFGGNLDKIAKIAGNANIEDAGHLVNTREKVLIMIIDNEINITKARGNDEWMKIVDRHFANRKLRLQLLKHNQSGHWLNIKSRLELRRSIFNVDLDVLRAVETCEDSMKGLSGAKLKVAQEMMSRNALKAAQTIKQFSKMGSKLTILTKSGKTLSIMNMFPEKQLAKMFLYANGDVDEIMKFAHTYFKEVDVPVKLQKTVLRNIFAVYDTTLKGKGMDKIPHRLLEGYAWRKRWKKSAASGTGSGASGAGGGGSSSKPITGGGVGAVDDLGHLDDFDDLAPPSSPNPTRGGGAGGVAGALDEGDVAVATSPKMRPAGIKIAPESLPGIEKKLAGLGQLDDALEQAKLVSTNPSEIAATQEFVQEVLDVPPEQALSKSKALMAKSPSNLTIGLRVLGFIGIAFEGYTAVSSFMSANEVAEFNQAKARVLRAKGGFELASGIAGGVLLAGEMGGMMIGGVALIPGIGQVALVVGAVVLIVSNIAKDLIFHTMDRYTSNVEELKKSHTKQLVYNHIISVAAGRSDTDQAWYEPLGEIFGNLDLLGGKTTEGALEALVYLEELDNFPLTQYYHLTDTDKKELFSPRFENSFLDYGAFNRAIDEHHSDLIEAKEARFNHIIEALGRYDHVTPASTMTVPDPTKMEGKGSITVRIPEKRKSLLKLVPSDQYKGNPAFMAALKRNEGIVWLQQLVEETASLSPTYEESVAVTGITEPLIPQMMLDDMGMPTSAFIPRTPERLQQNPHIQKGPNALDNALHEIATDVRGMHIPNTDEALRGAYVSAHAADYGLYFHKGKLAINNEWEIDKVFTREGAHIETFKAIQKELDESLDEEDLTNQGTGEILIMNEVGKEYKRIFQKYEDILTQDKEGFINKLYTFGQTEGFDKQWFQPPLEYLSEGIMLGYEHIGEALYKFDGGEIWVWRPDQPVKRLSTIKKELFGSQPQ